MKELFMSVSKLVFFLMAFTSCLGFVIGLLEAKDFMYLMGIVFTYYFTRKRYEIKGGKE